MSGEDQDRDVEREIGRKTRRSLLTGGLAALVGAGAWEWIRTRREDSSEAWPLRMGLRLNEEVWRDYSRNTRLVRTLPPSAVEAPRSTATWAWMATWVRTGSSRCKG